MIFSSPGFLEALTSCLANGGSPIDFCLEHKLRFDDLIVWINEDNARVKRYSLALRARDEYVVQNVLRELKRIFSIDIREAYDDNGCLRDIKKLSAELASVVSSIETDEIFEGTGKQRTWTGYTKKVKFWDKMKALELQMKNLAMLIERHDHTVTGEIQHMHDIKLENGEPLRFDIGAERNAN